MNTPKAKLSQKTIDLLADAAESAFDANSIKTLWPDPPINPSEPLPDQIVKVKDGIVCPHDTNGETNGEANGKTNGETNDETEGQADAEMPPLVEETEVWRLKYEEKMTDLEGQLLGENQVLVFTKWKKTFKMNQ